MYTVIALGPEPPDDDASWKASSRVRTVVRWRAASPNGTRFGSRALGIGLDALCVAVKTLCTPRARGPYLALNPWIGVALVLTGHRRVVVNGLYATPGSRSWSLLRAVLRRIPVVTTSAVESENWRRAGGRATVVRYGHTFGYPTATGGNPEFTIFVGGSSDRDPELIARLEREVRAWPHPVRTIVADGSAPGTVTSGHSTVVRPGWLAQDTFGATLAGSDVVFLPLRANGRSAGQMVLVGALEAGVPVLATGVAGVADFREVPGVGVLDPGAPLLLPQLLARAAIAAPDRRAMREAWRDQFSTAAYAHRLLDAAAVAV